MFKKIYFSKQNFILLLLMQITIIFIIFLTTIILTIQENAFGILELLLTFWILTTTTVYYQRYNNEDLLSRLKVNSLSSTRLKIYLFLFLVLIGVILILTYTVWFYLYSVFIENNVNVFGEEISPIDWSLFKWKAWFFLTFYEMIVLIGFGYFLNHFLKTRKTFIFGLIVFFVMYNTIFGSMWNIYLQAHTTNGTIYFHWRSDVNKVYVALNSILTPWALPGLWGKPIIYLNNTHPINIFNHSEINKFGTTYGWWFNQLMWLPFFYFVLEVCTSLIHSRMKSNKN